MTDRTVTAAGMRLIRLLVGHPPQTVAELMASAGVTRTAVTEQLNELLGCGLVVRRVERSTGRGRPRHVYSATPAADRLLPLDRPQIVPALLEAVAQVGGEELLRNVLGRTSQVLAERYLDRLRDHQGDAASRLQRLAEMLREDGVLAELDERDGNPVLRERACPYIEIMDDARTPCAVEREMMSAVVGATIVMTACRLDGCHCCQFELGQEVPLEASEPVTA